MRPLRYVALASLLAIGCVSIGREITESQLANFKKGETSIDQVIVALGKPTSTSVSSSGDRYISYIYARAQPRARSFVPIVGPLIGGSDSRSSHAFLIFGPDGKLKEYRLSTSSTGMGMGAASGSYETPTSSDQPKAAPR